VEETLITRIDLGCGPKKKEGCFGIDSVPNPGVDCVLNLTKDRLPFEDGTIDYIFSSHCLEHLNGISHLFKEISRVAKDGAILDIWLPYLWSVDAFIPCHIAYWGEGFYEHISLRHADFWRRSFNKSWLWRELTYSVYPETLQDMEARGVDIPFAIKYFKGVAYEFNAVFELRDDLTLPASKPRKSYCVNRQAQKVPFEVVSQSFLRSA